MRPNGIDDIKPKSVVKKLKESELLSVLMKEIEKLDKLASADKGKKRKSKYQVYEGRIHGRIVLGKVKK